MKRRHLPDAEYVEQIRRRDRFVRRAWWLYPILLVGFLYCLFNISDLFMRLTADFPIEKKMAYTGLMLGMVFGVLFSIIAVQAGLCLKQWTDSRKGYRTERLLLEYHDRLKEIESNKSIHGIVDSSPNHDA